MQLARCPHTQAAAAGQRSHALAGPHPGRVALRSLHTDSRRLPQLRLGARKRPQAQPEQQQRQEQPEQPPQEPEKIPVEQEIQPANDEASTSQLSPLDRLAAIAADGEKAGWQGEWGQGSMVSSIAQLNDEVSALRAAMAAAEERALTLEASVATSKDQLLRLNADFDNFRKRSATEKDQISSRVKGDVVEKLLPLVDNFELARTNVVAETEGEQKINNSYQGLYKQMVELMRSQGVEPVPTVGGLFDPSLHEAIMREEDDSVPDGTVIMEFRKGFKLGDRLLRPAMVKVSYSDAPAPRPAAESSSQSNGAAAEAPASEETAADAEQTQAR